MLFLAKVTANEEVVFAVRWLVPSAIDAEIVQVPVELFAVTTPVEALTEHPVENLLNRSYPRLQWKEWQLQSKCFRSSLLQIPRLQRQGFGMLY
jgi:hypothetical protein